MWLTFSKSSQTFSEELLNNFFGFERYMSGIGDLKKIENLSENLSALEKPTLSRPYFGGWHVLWICLNQPFYSTISLFFSSVAYALNRIWLNHYAAFFEVASKQLTRHWEQLGDQWSAKSPMLVPSLNAPKMSAWDVYMCKPYPTSSVLDPSMAACTPQKAVFQEEMDLALDRFYEDLSKQRASQNFLRKIAAKCCSVFSLRTFKRTQFKKAYEKSPAEAMKKLKEAYRWDPIEKPLANLYHALLSHSSSTSRFNLIEFYQSSGECRGGSEWFICLLLKSSHFFQDRVQQLLAVAKQFETGISGQGVVLQALLYAPQKLGHRVTCMENHTISTYELDEDRVSAHKKIDSLPAGIYKVGVFRHSLVYVKLKNGESYTWDPDYGLYEHTADAFLSFTLNHHYVRENPLSHIYFERHESAS